ncbi:MAG: Fe-S cluster assembly protein SufD [Candidatus Zixiibacteriota bacterium]|nr:MAG: Fe-S cluster assembly protein SufD [candidate division Zixibacteria bacterium]
MANGAVINKGKSEIARMKFRPILKSESEWLYRLRKAGWDYYHSSPLPDRSDHLWRYTDPNLFLPGSPEKILESSHGKSEQLSSGGFLISDHGSELEDKGVILENLKTAISNHGELIRNYFGKAINSDFGKFESLNMAIWDIGLFLYIPENTIINEPIHIRYIPTSELGARRMLLIIGGGSEVTIIDDYAANGKFIGLMTNNATEIFAAKNSKVKYLSLNRLEEDHTLYLTDRVIIESDVSFESVYAGFGGRISKVNTGVILDGKGANSRITGFVYSDMERKADYHTRHHHKSGDTYSDLDFKVVLKDKARSAYTGLIRIEKDAANCEAYQENRNLLLNEGANAESIPELEILTDQVRCSHGATVGPIDPEMIFFLKSRGFSESEAIRLIIEGFFESTLAKSPEILKDILANEIGGKLGGI